jgi:subtilisin family serine protease
MHGTQVAGISAADTNNGLGIAGALGPTVTTRLIPVKVLAAESNPMLVSGSTTDIVEGVSYAVAQGASVINLSLGSANKSAALCNAIGAARAAGTLVVAAAGNAGLDNDTFGFYPASYPFDNVVSVMASDKSDRILLGNSNHGCESVDIAGPGEAIRTPIVASGSFLDDSGTSMAAPFVSAAAALVRSMNPKWTPAMVREHLMDTADKGTLRNAANGRLNMLNALTSPVKLRTGSVPKLVASQTVITVKWKQKTHTRACPTVYVRLLPAGTVGTHDACSDAATCRELATNVPVANKKATVTLPTLATTRARIRVGCDGSGLFSEHGPFQITL